MHKMPLRVMFHLFVLMGVVDANGLDPYQNFDNNVQQCLEDILPKDFPSQHPEAWEAIENHLQSKFSNRGGINYLEKEESMIYNNSSFVAFSAEATNDRSIGHEGTITFDRVITNVGNHFIPLAGLFQCPDDDWYFAMWSLQAPSGRVAASLVKAGETIKYGPISAEVPDSHSGTASMSSVLQCKTGDFVWLKAEAWPDSHVCNTVQSLYSSFTMFKIPLGDDEDKVSMLTAELSMNSTIAGDIVFDSVLSQVGDNYNPSTGEFTCEEDGIHVFVFGGHVGNRIYNCIDIHLNDETYFHGPVLAHRWPEAEDSGTSSTARLVRCEQDDVITMYSPSSYDFLGQLTYMSTFKLPSQDIVAFSAQLSQDVDITNGFTIPFDAVTINEGGRFTPVHGLFVCPDNAFYLFTWSISGRQELEERPLSAKLMMGNEEVKSGPQTIKPYNANEYTSVSTQVIVQCIPDTSVYIHAVVVSSENQRIAWQFTDFSGFRLEAGDEVDI